MEKSARAHHPAKASAKGSSLHGRALVLPQAAVVDEDGKVDALGREWRVEARGGANITF